MNLMSLLTTPNSRRAFVDELSGVFRLDDARFGSLVPSGLADYYSKFQEMVAGYDSRVTEVNLIEHENKRVEEIDLLLCGKEPLTRLPVAVVYDQTGQGLHIRLYYSNYPIDQTHQDRAAILPANHGLTLPAPVSSYQKAFSEGDLDATLATLEHTATVREPSGGTFGADPGHTGLKDFYKFLYSFGGGIPLEYCTVIANVKSCALEYNIVRVGSHTYSPQAGLAVYDFNENKLTGIRIYDDFVPS